MKSRESSNSLCSNSSSRRGFGGFSNFQSRGTNNFKSQMIHHLIEINVNSLSSLTSNSLKRKNPPPKSLSSHSFDFESLQSVPGGGAAADVNKNLSNHLYQQDSLTPGSLYSSQLVDPF